MFFNSAHAGQRTQSNKQTQHTCHRGFSASDDVARPPPRPHQKREIERMDR